MNTENRTCIKALEEVREYVLEKMITAQGHVWDELDGLLVDIGTRLARLWDKERAGGEIEV